MNSISKHPFLLFVMQAQEQRERELDVLIFQSNETLQLILKHKYCYAYCK